MVDSGAVLIRYVSDAVFDSDGTEPSASRCTSSIGTRSAYRKLPALVPEPVEAKKMTLLRGSAEKPYAPNLLVTHAPVQPSNGPQIGSEFTSSSSVEFSAANGPLALNATVLPLFCAVPSIRSHSSARKPVGC